MRFSLLLPLTCVTALTAALVACVGDDPTAPVATNGTDGGTNTPGTDGGGGGGGDDSGTNPGDAGDGGEVDAGPLCAKIQVSTLTGTGAAGIVEGAGNQAQFNGADGITVNPTDGTLFVGDSFNKRVRKVLSDGTTSTYAQHATNMYSATRLGYRSGDLYVIDRTNDALLRVVDGTPPTVGIVVQTGALVAVGTSPGGAIYTTQTQNCYVSKLSGSNLVHFTGKMPVGQDVGCGSMDGDVSVARFSGSVIDFAFDGPGTMYAVDSGNFRIRRIDEATGDVATLAGSSKGYADGTGTAAKFDSPTGATVDPQTHVVYVADGTRIRAVTKEGVVTTLVGSTSGFDDGSGCSAKFGELRGITYYAGALYAVDVNRVRKIKLP